MPEWMANRRKPAALEQAPWESKNRKGKVSTFGRKLRDWWMGLQPECRGGEWPLVRTIPDDADWAEVKKGGSTGFCLIVIGLNWWVRYAKSTKDKNEAASMLEDVVFVLGKMLESMDKSSDGEPSKKKKRLVISRSSAD